VPVRRSPSFAETLKAIIAWWRGKRPDLRQGILEREVIEMLFEEFADAAALEADGGNVSASAQGTRSFDNLRRLL